MLPHDQAFYDEEAADRRRELLHSSATLLHPCCDDQTAPQRHPFPNGRDWAPDPSRSTTSAKNEIIAGVGGILATAGGSETFSIFRFLQPTMTVRVGDTVEWVNLDPVTPHTVTFGTEPANTNPPSSNVTVDEDAAEHATISSPSNSVHSGFIVAAPQDRAGLAQSPPGVTRFRVTFTTPGTFNYICSLHDQTGMVGQIVVLP